jgi:hypothetical protein
MVSKRGIQNRGYQLWIPTWIPAFPLADGCTGLATGRAGRREHKFSQVVRTFQPEFSGVFMGLALATLCTAAFSAANFNNP